MSRTLEGLNLVLTTERLLLRPVDVDDVDLLWPDMSDPEIPRHMAWEAHTGKEQTAAFLEGEVARRKGGRGVTWAIFREGEFCGIVSLIGVTRTHRALTYDKGEIAYWLGRRCRGQGIMTEAGRRVLAFAFEELRLHKVWVGHFVGNAASENLIKRLGFRYVGEQLDEFCKAGVWYSHRMYEILDREWSAAVATTTGSRGALNG